MRWFRINYALQHVHNGWRIAMVKSCGYTTVLSIISVGLGHSSSSSIDIARCLFFSTSKKIYVVLNQWNGPVFSHSPLLAGLWNIINLVSFFCHMYYSYVWLLYAYRESFREFASIKMRKRDYNSPGGGCHGAGAIDHKNCEMHLIVSTQAEIEESIAYERLTRPELWFVLQTSWFQKYFNAARILGPIFWSSLVLVYTFIRLRLFRRVDIYCP